jgi:hypothetical protein
MIHSRLSSDPQAAPLVEAHLDTRNNSKHGRTRRAPVMGLIERRVPHHDWLHMPDANVAGHSRLTGGLHSQP